MLEPDRGGVVGKRNPRMRFCTSRAVDLEGPELVRGPEHEVEEDDIGPSVKKASPRDGELHQLLEVVPGSERVRLGGEVPPRTAPKRSRELLDRGVVKPKNTMSEPQVAEVPSKRVRVREDGAVGNEHVPLGREVRREGEHRVHEESPSPNPRGISPPRGTDAGEEDADASLHAEIRRVPESGAEHIDWADAEGEYALLRSCPPDRRGRLA